jgi:hypothetical protein
LQDIADEDEERLQRRKTKKFTGTLNFTGRSPAAILDLMPCGTLESTTGYHAAFY